MEYKKLPIDQVELDLANPRIKQWLEIYGDDITSEGIALALSASSGTSSTSTYSALKESIRVNKGIINPIIVNRTSEGKLIVIEGNTRLQIYKEFAMADPEGPWKEIIAIVYDALPVEQIHAIRLQTHLVGPREWDPFSKAKYLNQLSNIDKLPMAMIISFCGGKSAEIRKLIDAYTDMTKYYFKKADEAGIDPDPREFSKFAELQNRSIKEALAVYTDFEPIQYRMYRTVLHELEIEVKRDGKAVVDDDSVALKRLLRLLQITSNPKLLHETYTAISGKEQRLESMLEEICSVGDKCIVWSNFIENIDGFCAKFKKYHPCKIHGSNFTIGRPSWLSSIRP